MGTQPIQNLVIATLLSLSGNSPKEFFRFRCVETKHKNYTYPELCIFSSRNSHKLYKKIASWTIILQIPNCGCYACATNIIFMESYFFSLPVNVAISIMPVGLKVWAYVKASHRISRPSASVLLIWTKHTILWDIYDNSSCSWHYEA